MNTPLTRPSATLSRRERDLRVRPSHPSPSARRCRSAADEGLGIFVFVLAAFFAAPISAQSIASTANGIVIAHDNVIELQGGWSVAGVKNPGRIIVGNSRVAVLDPIANELRVVDLESGRAQHFATGETPIDGLFIGRDFFIIERNARTLERCGADGTTASIDTAADPAFIREANGLIYVYARVAGMLHEIDPRTMKITRETRVAPFATDMELDDGNAYLVDARTAKMHVVDLATLKAQEDIEVGVVPVDMAFVKGPTPISARTLAVADPSAKRVWVVEGVQSLTQAVTRGFLRGLLGAGLFSRGASQFPTGVDRVFIRGSRWIAYDSASGTLYSFTKTKSTPIAKDVGPNAFALTAGGVVWWDNAVRRLQKLPD